MEIRQKTDSADSVGDGALVESLRFSAKTARGLRLAGIKTAGQVRDLVEGKIEIRHRELSGKVRRELAEWVALL